MKLSDLKQGMICERRKVENITILNEVDYYASKSGTNEIYKNYNEDLTFVGSSDYDIIKVMHSNGEVIYTRPEKVSRWFEPKVGERYYYLNRGYIVFTNFTDDIDNRKIRTVQQVFRTEKEAQAHLLFMQAELKIKKWIAENDDVVLDWNNLDQRKHVPYYNLERKELGTVTIYTSHYTLNSMYLSSKKLVEQLIKECEKELLIYLGVN